VDDEDDKSNTSLAKESMSDMRQRKLGTVIAELGEIKEGAADAHLFEKWVFDATRYLFAKALDSISWKPRQGQAQERGIVGTIRHANGFWKRVAAYEVAQLLIEACNTQGVGEAYFREACARLGGSHGRFLLMITRAEQEGITEYERAFVRSAYQAERKLVVIFPAIVLQRMLRKMQSAEKRDNYIEKKLVKRLDLFERDFVPRSGTKRDSAPPVVPF
jgi:hypothetical protein